MSERDEKRKKRERETVLLALLAAEKKSTAAALAVVSLSVLPRGSLAPMVAVTASAERIRQNAESVIGDIHASARRSGVQSVKKDLARLGRALGVDMGNMNLSSPNAKTDSVIAKGLADSVASGWLVTAATEIANGRSFRDAVREATRSRRRQLETIAITETSRTFSDERANAARELAKNKQAALLVYREWDATLDKRTCDVCGGLNGTKTKLGTDFPGGHEPGAVHPRCRCVEHWVIE